MPIMYIFIPALVCIIGLVIYALTENAKVQAISKDMFWTGLLVTLLQLTTATLKLD